MKTCLKSFAAVVKYTAFLPLLFVITACGGGGDTSTPSPNPNPPVTPKAAISLGSYTLQTEVRDTNGNVVSNCNCGSAVVLPSGEIWVAFEQYPLVEDYGYGVLLTTQTQSTSSFTADYTYYEASVSVAEGSLASPGTFNANQFSFSLTVKGQSVNVEAVKSTDATSIDLFSLSSGSGELEFSEDPYSRISVTTNGDVNGEVLGCPISDGELADVSNSSHVFSLSLSFDSCSNDSLSNQSFFGAAFTLPGISNHGLQLLFADDNGYFRQAYAEKLADTGSADYTTETAPTISSLTVTGAETVTLHWYSEDQTSIPTTGTSYTVYASTQPDFQPLPSHLVHVTGNALSADIDSLASDTEYYFKVIAKTEDKQILISSEIAAKTYKSSPVQAQGTTIFQAEDNNLTLTSASSDTLVFTLSAGANVPAPGDFIFAKNADDELLFKQVISVSSSNNEATVLVTQPSLSELIPSAELTDYTSLGSVSGFAPDSRKVVPTASGKYPANTSPTKAERWGNSISNTAYYKPYKKAHLTQNGESVNVTFDGDKITLDIDGVTGSISLDPEIDIAPSVYSDFAWAGPLEIARAESRLDATVDLSLSVDSSISVDLLDFEKKIDVPSLTFKNTKIYAIGPIPVYQEIIFTLHAVISSTSSAGIDVSTGLHRKYKLTAGASYNGLTEEWDGILNGPTLLSQSSTASAAVHIGANLELRIVPKIELRFYTVAAPYFSVEPYASAEIEVGNGVTFDSLSGNTQVTPTQFNTFNVELGLECFVGFEFGILVPNKFSLKSKNVCPFVEPNVLWAIPEFQFDVDTESTTSDFATISASVSNDLGYNELDASSATWDIYPDDFILIPHSDDPLKADVQLTSNANEEGEYTILFSATDKLGEIGRQYESGKIRFGDCITEINEAYTSMDQLPVDESLRLSQYACYHTPAQNEFGFRAENALFARSYFQVNEEVYEGPLSPLEVLNAGEFRYKKHVGTLDIPFFTVAESRYVVYGNYGREIDGIYTKYREVIFKALSDEPFERLRRTASGDDKPYFVPKQSVEAELTYNVGIPSYNLTYFNGLDDTDTRGAIYYIYKYRCSQRTKETEGYTIYGELVYESYTEMSENDDTCLSNAEAKRLNSIDPIRDNYFYLDYKHRYSDLLEIIFAIKDE